MKAVNNISWKAVKNISWNEILCRAEAIAECIDNNPYIGRPTPISIYGIPRGGIYAAQAVLSFIEKGALLVEYPSDSCVFIDDIIDTGKTKDKFISEYPNLHFFALVDKLGEDKDWRNSWVVFPWERMIKEEGPENNIIRILEYIGEDPNREGLKETPKRVVCSYEELYAGYKKKPADVIKTFDSDCDEMVVLKNIEFYSTCEHHMLPFFGKAHIAYIPKGKVIGVSKLARILEVYTRRLQIQEQIGEQVTEAIDNMISPLGVACVLEAQHFCMTSRGVQKQNSIMVTSSLTGVFKDKPEVRVEFLSMIGK